MKRKGRKGKNEDFHFLFVYLGINQYFCIVISRDERLYLYETTDKPPGCCGGLGDDMPGRGEGWGAGA